MCVHQLYYKGFKDDLFNSFFNELEFFFQHMVVFNWSLRRVKTQMSKLEGNVNNRFILILSKSLPDDKIKILL